MPPRFLLFCLFIAGCNSNDSDENGLSSKTDSPSTSENAHAGDTRSDAEEDRKITLHGKVNDQHGSPVPEATVRFFVYSDPDEEDGSEEILKTDAEGKFSITNRTGASVGVLAMKDGYMRIPPMSHRSSSAVVDYAGRAETDLEYADPSNPLVLELLKIGEMEPLIHVEKKRWKLAVDGAVQKIALDTEEGKGSHELD